MGNLPEIRINQAEPFEYTGIDYCGPFYVKQRDFRNRGKDKVWVVVFVCMVVKAVHLEVVRDLSTLTFIAALRRFCSRKGYPHFISSDNAKNFVGAKNELNEIYDLFKTEHFKSEIKNYCEQWQIKWNFIPPLAPHMGGLWESTVKLFKHHFKRVAGNSLLTKDQFDTLIVEIESCLNSRPITPISNDPNDLQALTPGHFLIGRPLRNLPEIDLVKTPTNRLNLWEHINKMKQDFWTRWKLEYLNELNLRNKWTSGDHNIQKGTMVILKEINLPPLQWELGRVIALHPGDDGITRTVTVKTASGDFKRNIKQVSPLPIEEYNKDNHK